MKKIETTKIMGLLIIVVILLTACSSIWNNIYATLPQLYGKPDGVYRGSYSVSRTLVRVILDVTVRNERLSDIKIIEHMGSSIGKKAEKITGRIIAQQSLNVDVVSGATISSKAILKAVENALE